MGINRHHGRGPSGGLPAVNFGSPGFGRHGGGGAANPGTIVASTSQLAWWQIGVSQAYSDLGTTPVETDGSSVRQIDTGDGSLAGYQMTTGSGNEPTLQTRDGVRVMRTNGTNQYIEKSFSWDGGKTFFFVGYNEDGVQHRLLSSADSDNATRQHVIIQADNTLTIYGRSGGATGAVTPTVPVGWYCIVVEFAGDASTVAINGYQETYTTTPGDNTVSGGFRVGRQNDGSGWSALDIHAWGAVDGLLTMSERVGLMSWGMSIAPVASPTTSPRTTDSYSVDISRVRSGAGTYVGTGSAHMPCYLAFFYDARTDSNFDGVTNAAGERLNWLMLTGRDHSSAANPGTFADGIYIACLFGDPMMGAWKRWDDALDDGDLDDYAGTKPTTYTDGRVLLYNTECETPSMFKVGSVYNMILQIKSVAGTSQQGSVRATSASPFGPWVIENEGVSGEAFLDNSLPGADHTGYAMGYPTPANSTATSGYVLHSLHSGSTGATFATWTTDAAMSKASVTREHYQVPWYPGVNSPVGEIDAGESMKFPINNHSLPKWNGSNFTTITTGITEGVGIDPQASILFEARLDVDLEQLDETYTPDLLLRPTDFGAFFPHSLGGLTRPQVFDLADGSKVLFVSGEGRDAQGREGYVFAMPITETIS